MARKKTKTKPGRIPPFEESLRGLKESVEHLESGELSLDASLEQYELGIRHLKHCYQSLQQAEQKIRTLVDVDDQGRLRTEPFDGSATWSGPARRDAVDELEDSADEQLDELDEEDDLGQLF